MANEFTDSDVVGTLTINGGSIGRAIAAMRGASSSSTGILAVTGDATGTELKVVAQGTPDMTVSVNAGDAIVAGVFCGVKAATNSATVTAPTTNPRIDIVQLATDGTISIKAGTENASPSAPTVDSGNMKLAELYLRVGATSIKNSDDATNGYITDARTQFI